MEQKKSSCGCGFGLKRISPRKSSFGNNYPQSADPSAKFYAGGADYSLYGLQKTGACDSSVYGNIQMRFGKRKVRKPRKVKKIPKAILRQCKRLKIKVSVKRGSKRVRKSLKQLKREIKKRLKKLQKKRH